MRKLFLLLVVMLPLLVVAGCEEGPTEPTVSTTGTWTGTAQLGGAPVSINLILAEFSRNIAGPATVTSAAGTVSADVTGRNNYPDVTMRLRQGTFDVTYQASFTGGNTLEGTLTGSGFSNTQLTLQRQ